MEDVMFLSKFSFRKVYGKLDENEKDHEEIFTILDKSRDEHDKIFLKLDRIEKKVDVHDVALKKAKKLSKPQELVVSTNTTGCLFFASCYNFASGTGTYN